MSADRPGHERPKVTKRCATCGRFRAYDGEDAFCIACGNDSLEDRCACGRDFDYALVEDGDLYCPGCGSRLRGRASEFHD